MFTICLLKMILGAIHSRGYDAKIRLSKDPHKFPCTIEQNEWFKSVVLLKGDGTLHIYPLKRKC